MTRPVKEAPSASANGKSRPVCRPDWKIRIAISAIPAPVLSSAAKLLLLRVADRAGYGRSTCWATNETLAFETGIVIRQVQRLLSGRTDSKTDLISTGWLTSTWKTTRKGGNAHRDLALGPKTLEWIERILPAIDAKSRPHLSMDWDDHLVAPRDDHLVAPRDDHLVAQNVPSIELPHMEQSSSSSTPPPRAKIRRRRRFASLSGIRGEQAEGQASPGRRGFGHGVPGREQVRPIARRRSQVSDRDRPALSVQARLVATGRGGRPARRESGGRRQQAQERGQRGRDDAPGNAVDGFPVRRARRVIRDCRSSAGPRPARSAGTRPTAPPGPRGPDCRPGTGPAQV